MIRIKAIVLMMILAIMVTGLPVEISIIFFMKKDDLLNGEGLFHNQTLGEFEKDHHHVTEFLVVNGSNILK